MKRISLKSIKKNEIIIYVLALMLVTAGYFNYSEKIKKEDTKETYSETAQNENVQNVNIGEAVLVSNNDVNEKIENRDENEETQESIENEKTENEEGKIENDADKSKENKQDNNESNNGSINDYYINSKIDRDKMYAQMIGNYENIINNSNASEVQKNIATQEIKKINNQKNAIMICENLILNKGFKNCLIFINEESVNIVVSIEGELAENKVAIIQNIVSREIAVEIENIHISTK